jgi:hypothetical protein
MNELTTARGDGRKRLGRIPAEDAHCQTINSKMGTTHGKARFAKILGRSWFLARIFLMLVHGFDRSSFAAQRLA